MVGVTPDNGSRRRLPHWMLGISSGVQVSKPGNVKENGKELLEGTQSHENETLEENPHVLVKCETKRRKRKSTEQDADFEDDVPETVPEKKRNGRGRRKVQEPAAPKRQKTKDPGEGIQLQEKETLEENSHFLTKCETKRRKSKSDEQEVRTSTVDDVELTVEDLVIIAEEYIEADRIMKREELSNQERESDRRLVERVCSGNVFEDSVDAQKGNQGSLIPDTTTSKPNGSLTSTEMNLNSSGRDDPAQDMLDLFLGPLLKKTVEKETKEKDRKAQMLTENMTFSQEFKRQSESSVIREEIPPAPIVKKKSSLRDKVAMFLD
ncbi:uncharacterized protein [Pyrus communis]|uniref:uncharacterized protein n=1 Tax=Pyrus communis TaxID=23211 RepID=UPI0035C1D74A